MANQFAVLARCPLFDGVSEGEIEAMLDCMGARRVSVPRGGLILRAEDPAEEMGILLSGAARVQRDDFYGNRAIQAALEPGDMFGEAFACAEVRRLPVSVEAVRDCEALMLRVGKVIGPCPSACAFHHRVVLNLLREMAGKNLRLNRKLEITSRRTTREKLLAYLTGEAEQTGDTTFTIPFDRQGLADYLGVDRSALSSEIGKLRREGVLASEKSRFTLFKTAHIQ